MSRPPSPALLTTFPLFVPREVAPQMDPLLDLLISSSPILSRPTDYSISEDLEEDPFEEEPLEEQKEERKLEGPEKEADLYLLSHARRFAMWELINRVCKPYLDKSVIVFIDYIFIYSKSKEDHEIAKPLTTLTQKNQKYECGVEQKEAFQTLKDNLCNAQYCYLLRDQMTLWFIKMPQIKDSDVCDRLKLFSDHDCEIRYHLEKANVVANALSRKERVKPRRVRALSMTIQSSVKEKILAAQSEAFKLENTPVEILRDLNQQMEKKDAGGLYFMDQICIPLISDVKAVIKDEAHATRYYIHPGANKIYHDLRDMYWWQGFKRDIATYVSSWDTHLPLPEFSYNNGYHLSSRCAFFEALYGKKCRSPVLWTEVRENRLIGLEMVQETMDKVVLIKERLKAARDR
nr:putative reverse transcriptase domain-containing protein [Tanacetum cinerariifolium]